MADDAQAEDNPRLLVLALAGTAILAPIAYALAYILHIPLNELIRWSARDVVIGLAATALPAAFLFWLMKTELPALAEFRRSQIEFFAGVGFRFTPFRILLMAFFAGVFEELLFRGAIQTGLDKVLPGAAAILIASIIFGVLHWRTAFYALIATLIGVWLGVLFAMTENLLTPIVTHMAYDLVALAVTATAIDDYHRNKAAD